jgi:hypothetical protein
MPIDSRLSIRQPSHGRWQKALIVFDLAIDRSLNVDFPSPDYAYSLQQVRHALGMSTGVSPLLHGVGRQENLKNQCDP